MAVTVWDNALLYSCLVLCAGMLGMGKQVMLGETRRV